MAGEGPSVLADGHPREADELVGPPQLAPPGGCGVARPQELRGDPAEGGVGDQADALGRPVLAAEVVDDLPGDVPAVEGGDVGGVDGVLTDTALRSSRPGVFAAGNLLAEGAFVEGDAGGAGEFVVGFQSPVKTTVSQATVRRRPVSRCSISTAWQRPAPMTRVTRVRVATGTRGTVRPAALKAA
ncbi:hypothetical protein ACH4ND_17610 [Streptomyces sp. NPDC017179]|uniref:hypothetical protein n=1 Tax=Streptomyces sp. NPDC017179 TaxID=3364979 RepID=UPI00378D91CF